MNEAELRLRLDEAIERSLGGVGEYDTGDKIVGPRKHPRLWKIDMGAWSTIYVRLERPLGDAVMNENWEEVARLWAEKRWLIEKFVRGEPLDSP